MRYDEERGKRRAPGSWEPADDGERRRWHGDSEERHGGRGRGRGRGHFAGPFPGPGFPGGPAFPAGPSCTDSVRGAASAACAGHAPGAVMSGQRRSPCWPSSP